MGDGLVLSIPANLLRKLEEEATGLLPLNIERSAVECGVWLSRHNIMTFFPEYTDHAVLHLNSVLELADLIITDGSDGRPNSWNELTSRDAAVLILAVLLHDIGMHLRPQEFIELVARSPGDPRVPELDADSWSTLWHKYVSEVRRWDGRTRQRIVGTTELDSAVIGAGLCDPDAWTATDYRIIGEFLRRHHPRIAHEVARTGWLTPDSPLPRLDEMFGWELADMAGLVARSHGTDMRALFPYVEQRHFNVRESKGVHPFYLMAVLRIADYLNLHAERASSDARDLQKVSNPVSEREWDAHAAIYDIRLDTDIDPEAVLIDVSPRQLRNVHAFLRVDAWITGVQKEIDHSWAVLGEVYGRHDRLRNLWLSVRRLKSNVAALADDVSLPFVPIAVSFETAGADLLKLLIRPLYGNRPGVGIRELLQNSVDAVRERSYLDRDYHIDTLDADWPDADVLVRFSRRDAHESGPGALPQHWQSWVEVSDRGIGMRLDTLKHYFLRAGASFRYSDAWKKVFEADLEDNTRVRSQVLRSGRFGVGAIASFLIGTEICVSTRFLHDSHGYCFTAELETEHIQINRFERDVGTSVYVRVTADSLGEWQRNRGVSFDTDWYRLQWPVVVRLHDDGSQMYSGDHLPPQGAKLPAAWHRISHVGFDEIQWTYAPAPELVCNGIQISGDSSKSDWSVNAFGYDQTRSRVPLEVPNLSVFDPDGNLPLNLARTGLSNDRLPFEQALLDDVIRDFLAFALVYAPLQPLMGRAFASHVRSTYPGYTPGDRTPLWVRHSEPAATTVPWVSTSEGVTLLDPYLVRYAGITELIGVVRHRKARWVPSFQTPSGIGIVGFDTDAEDLAGRVWPLNERMFFPRRCNPLRNLNVLGAAALVSTRVGESFRESMTIAPTANREEYAVESHGSFELWRTGAVRSNALDGLTGYKPLQRRSADAAFVFSWLLNEEDNKMVASRLAEAWKSIFRTPVIPYDVEARRMLRRECQPVLHSYIEAWESQATNAVPEGWRWVETNTSNEEYSGEQ